MRPGHWLGSVLCVSFSAVTLLVGCQERHLVCKKTAVPLILKRSFIEQAEEETEGELANQDSIGACLILTLLWVAIPTLSQRAPSAFHF